MNKSGDRVRSWRGQTQAAIEPPKYRWQTEVDSRAKRSSPGRGRRWSLWGFLLVSLVSLAAWVYLLLFLPTKTPLITVASTSYEWPLPPNAWALEDVQAFEALDGKTIQWLDATPAWHHKPAALESLRSQLQEALPLAKKSGRLIVYLNLHGAVNEQNVPCLLPPRASPLVSSQWIGLDELLPIVTTEVPASVETLLVLDCVDQLVNWHTALLDNTFVENLRRWLEAHSVPHVHVLCSVAEGQQAWSGPDLAASIFGREFRLGLAGAADRPRAGAVGGGGDGDGAVSLRELVDYLQTHVDAWTQEHRGASQTPQLITSSAREVRLGWALTPRELSRQMAAVRGQAPVPPSVSAEEQAPLWRQWDQLRQAGVYRLDPENWLQLERRLLWLDALSQAGAAYSEQARKQLLPELVARLQQAVTRHGELAGSVDQHAQAHVLWAAPPGRSVHGPLPSLALKELTGELSSAAASDVRRRLLEAAAAGGTEDPAEIARSLGLTLEANSWSELNFQQLVSKYQCAAVWPDQTLIGRVLELRQRCEQLAVLGDVRGHRWRRASIARVDDWRRQVEDQLLLGAGPARTLPLAEWDQAVGELDGDAAGLEQRIDAAWNLRDRGLSEIAYLAAWICSPTTRMDDLGDWRLLAGDLETPAGQASDAPSTSSSSLSSSSAGVEEAFEREQIAMQELLRLIYGLHDLGALLVGAQQRGEASIDPLQVAASNIQRDLQSLKALVGDHVQRAVRASNLGSRLPGEIAGLLELPFLSADDRLALHRKLAEYYRSASAAAPSPALAGLVPTTPQLPASQLPASQLAAEARSSLDPQSSIKPPSVEIPFSQRLRSWEVHPLTALLMLKDSLLYPRAGLVAPALTPSEAVTSEAVPLGAGGAGKNPQREATDVANARLRRHYLATLSFTGERLEDWLRTTGVQMLGEAQPVDAADMADWRRAGIAEHVARGLLPISPLRLETYSTAEFRQLALQDMLLWYAERTLDDFYADAVPGMWGAVDSYTFFERAALQVLDWAAQMKVASADAADWAGQLRRRLDVLTAVARSGLRASVRMGPPDPSSELRSLELSVHSAVTALSPSSAAGRDVPPGTATALVRSPAGIAP